LHQAGELGLADRFRPAGVEAVVKNQVNGQRRTRAGGKHGRDRQSRHTGFHRKTSYACHDNRSSN